MKPFKRSYLISLIIFLSLSFTFSAGFFARDALAFFTHTDKDFPILDEVYTLLVERGFDPLPAPPALEYGMIRGMLQAYGDPHTVFLEPVQTELESDSLRGKFGGIGVELGKDAEGFFILYPFTDGPASKAGILEGDRLLGAGDLVVDKNTSLDSIVAAIRGKVGEAVTLTIARPPDYQSIKIPVVRSEITLPSVSWHLEPSEPRLGVIQINLIAASSADEVIRAAKDLQSRGATHFILDLRNNGGGLLDAGVDVARLFLQDGDVIQQQYRDQDVKTYKVDHPGELAEIPLVILVNQNTASAAEIIAGALQAHHRATLIGAPTYGKDTIQLVFNLKDKSSFHVTAAHWWIPGLEFPRQDSGLEPDILITETADDPDLPIRTAIETLFSGPG